MAHYPAQPQWQPPQPPPPMPMQYAPPQRRRHSAAILVPLWIIAILMFLIASPYLFAFFRGLFFGI